MSTMFRSFISVAKQYQNNPTEENMQNVLKQFDVLMGETSSATDLQFFDPRDLLVAESLIKMMDLLLDMKPEIVQKLFFLLGNLGNCPRLQESLCCELHLHSSLALFLQNYGASNRDTLVFQCLKLLEVYTYHAVLSTVESPIEYLLQSIFKEIQSSFSETLTPCLGILSNLCRNSPAVVLYIKTLPNFKKIIVALLEKVSCNLQSVVPHSMIILHMLTRGEAVGNLVFNERNVCQAIEMVTRVCSTDDLSAQRAATNLLSALLTTPEYQIHIAQCNQLDSALTSIWKALLKSRSPFFVCNLERLLVSMFSVRNMCLPVLQALLHLSEEEVAQMLTSLQEWATSSDTNVFIHKVDVLAWQLLINLIQELFKMDNGVVYLDFVEATLLAALSQSMQTNIDFESPDLKLHLEKLTYLLKFVHLLDQFEATKELLKALKPDHFQRVIIHQATNCSLVEGKGHLETVTEIVLLAVVIMESLITRSDVIRDAYVEILQDKNVLPFIAAGLSSADQSQVQRALNTVCHATSFLEFPTELLCAEIVTNNKHKQPSVQKENSTQVVGSKRLSDVSSRRQSLDNSVQLLISKLESGLEIRDLDYSDIMEMYENKVHMLLRQNQELNKVIETKSSALQQSDKLMSQYRCLQAQHEAEVLKLRSLLKESERRSEQAKEQVKNLIIEKDCLKSKLKESEQAIASLQKEREELSELSQDAAQRIKSAQLQIEELQVNAENLREVNSVLQKHNNNFQLKQDSLLEEAKNLQNEKRGLTKQLKDKEVKVKELGTALEKCKEELRLKDESLMSACKSTEDLKEQLADLQKKNSGLSVEVSSLHKLCTQHQNTLLEKSQENQVLHEKYSEQKKLTEQILALCAQRNLS